MKILKAALLLPGLLIFALSVKAWLGVDDVRAAIEGAVELESAVALPENEGRLVILRGAPEMTAPVYDEELALTLDTVKALRYKEVYKKVKNEGGKSTWDWTAAGMQTLVGGAKVGEFTLSDEMIAAFPAESDYADFDAQEAARYSLYQPAGSPLTYVLPEGAYYYKEDTRENVAENRFIRELNREIIESRDGAEGYRYRFFDPQKNGEMTFVGRQEGHMLTDSGVDGVGRVFSGVKTKEAIAGENESTLVMGSRMGMVCGAALMILAAKAGNRKKGNQQRKKG